MLKYLVILCLLTVLIPGCERESKSDCDSHFCTDEFRIINIQIKHKVDSSAVILTSFKVIRLSDNNDITPGKSIIPENYGFYPLVDDNDQQMLKNSNTEIVFQGFIDNNLVIEKHFVVTADCCHVSLVSGDTKGYI